MTVDSSSPEGKDTEALCSHPLPSLTSSSSRYSHHHPACADASGVYLPPRADAYAYVSALRWLDRCAAEELYPACVAVRP